METGTTRTAEVPGALSLVDVVDVFVRRWRIWFFTPVVAGLLAVIVSLLLPIQFRSTASFVPEGRNMTGGAITDLLGEQAAALGLSGIQGAAGASAEFYVDLLRSRAVRERVVGTSYRDEGGREVGTLVEFFEYDELQPRELAEEKAERRLADRTRVARSVGSGIVTIAVTAPDPAVARQITDRYLEVIREFNSSQRSLRARDLVDYLETQLSVAREELRAVEDTLENFLEQNRQYQASPSLSFEKARLDRQLTIATSITQSLEQQYQEAQLDLITEIPAISVIDHPNVPQDKVWPRRTMIVLTVTFLGFFVGLLGALMVEGADRVVRQGLSPQARDRLDGVFRRSSS